MALLKVKFVKNWKCLECWRFKLTSTFFQTRFRIKIASIKWDSIKSFFRNESLNLKTSVRKEKKKKRFSDKFESFFLRNSWPQKDSFILMINRSKVVIVFFLRLSDSLQGYHEKRLLNHLLNNYNLLERPVANESDPLEVRFGLTLQQIIDVVSLMLETKLES